MMIRSIATSSALLAAALLASPLKAADLAVDLQLHVEHRQAGAGRQCNLVEPGDRLGLAIRRFVVALEHQVLDDPVLPVSYHPQVAAELIQRKLGEEAEPSETEESRE